MCKDEKIVRCTLHLANPCKVVAHGFSSLPLQVLLISISSLPARLLFPGKRQDNGGAVVEMMALGKQQVIAINTVKMKVLVWMRFSQARVMIRWSCSGSRVC